jgi:hypothetical protein
VSQFPVRHCERSEAIQGPQYRPSGLLPLRMLWPLDCFVASAPRNDGWVDADPIASVVIGRRLNATTEDLRDNSIRPAPRIGSRELAANYLLLATYGSTDYVRSDCLMGYRQVFTDMAARPRRRHHRIGFRRRSSGVSFAAPARCHSDGGPIAARALATPNRRDESSAYRNDWLIASSAFEPGQRSTSDISFSGVCDVPRRRCRFIGSSFM